MSNERADGVLGRNTIGESSPRVAVTMSGDLPPRRSAAAMRRVSKKFRPTVGVLVAMAAWEAFARSGLPDPHTFPPLTTNLRVLFEEAGQLEFWWAVASTLRAWATGLAICIVCAVGAGLAIGSSPLVYRATRPIVEFLRPVPSVALIPLAILVWGTGPNSELFLICFASFWPILIHTAHGVRDVDPVAAETARSFNVSRFAQLRRVTVPTALPYAVTGIRISASVALILAITAELILGVEGLGREISAAQGAGRHSLMYAMILATGVLGVAVNASLSLVEQRILHWHVSQRFLGATA